MLENFYFKSKPCLSAVYNLKTLNDIYKHMSCISTMILKHTSATSIQLSSVKIC